MLLVAYLLTNKLFPYLEQTMGCQVSVSELFIFGYNPAKCW